jgi:ankyrin repeat protein
MEKPPEIRVAQSTIPWTPCCQNPGSKTLAAKILPRLLLQVEALVETGADPAATDTKGLAGMHFAAAHGQLDVVRFLWTKGVELDSEDPGTRPRGLRRDPRLQMLCCGCQAS